MKPVTGVMTPDTLSHNAVSVLVTATKIVDTATARRSVVIQNLSASDAIYIGGASVTTSTGIKLLPGADITIYTISAVYGISGGTTANVRYLEEI